MEDANVEPDIQARYRIEGVGRRQTRMLVNDLIGPQTLVGQGLFVGRDRGRLRWRSLGIPIRWQRRGRLRP